MLPVERTYTVVRGPETDGGFSVRIPAFRGAHARAIRLKNASSAHVRSSSSTLKS